jgi:hypothetical protein
MRLSYRQMECGDIPTCVGIMAAHPVQRLRYGPTIKLLSRVWSRLVGLESFRTDVFEKADSDSGGRRSIALGVSVFITEDFLQRLKTTPFVWIGPELTVLVARDRSPLLSDREVAEANSNNGLISVVWAGCVHPEFSHELEVHNLMVRAFTEQHYGFRLRELIAAQAESQEQLQAALNAGAFLFHHNDGIYVCPSNENIRDLAEKPHILGTTRALATRQTGTWISELFHNYHEPRIRFNRSQQRLLTAAMNGDTDVQLAEELGISLATLKTTWRVIYDRVNERAPEILPADSSREEWGTERGKTKKYRLLFYLRSHPEELRPIARKTH